MNSSGKKFNIILILILVTLLVVYGIAIVFLKKAEANYENSVKVLEEETVKISGNQIIEKLLIDTKVERERIAQMFISQAGLSRFFESIESYGESVGVTVELLSLQDNSPQGLKLFYQASGSYNGLYNFLQLLENLQYDVEVNKITLKKSGELWTMNFELDLKSFAGEIRDPKSQVNQQRN